MMDESEQGMLLNALTAAEHQLTTAFDLAREFSDDIILVARIRDARTDVELITRSVRDGR